MKKYMLSLLILLSIVMIYNTKTFATSTEGFSIVKTTNEEYYVNQVNWTGDGKCLSTIQGKKECRRTNQASGDHYMYFDVTGADILNSSAVEVKVLYFDSGTDKFQLQYYNKSGVLILDEFVTKLNTNSWREFSWYLDDFQFANNLNGSDFRISANGDGDEYIAAVTVVKVIGSVAGANNTSLVPVGTVSLTTFNNKNAWKIDGQGTKYSYFRIDDYIDSTDNKVYITVRYCDIGNDSLKIEYNSTTSDYQSTSSIYKRNTGKYYEYTFVLNNSKFEGRQLNGADFRISNKGDGVEYISEVRVGKAYTISGVINDSRTSSSAHNPFIILSGRSEGDLIYSQNASYYLVAPPGIYDIRVSGKKLNGSEEDRVIIGNYSTTTRNYSLVPTDVNVFLKSSNINSGLIQNEYTGDGNTLSGIKVGVECRATTVDTYQYMYFDVDDNYIKDNYTDVVITFDYFDEGTDKIALQYESSSSTYTTAGVVTKTNTLTWKQAVFYIYNAKMNNGMNGGNDLRIANYGDGKDYIRYVSVSKITKYQIKDNHLEIDNQSEFLIVAHPLKNYEEADYSFVVPILREKGYDTLKMSLSWQFYEPSENNYVNFNTLLRLINKAADYGMHTILTLEVYSVGTVPLPSWVFNNYPSIQAKNSDGNLAIDNEYNCGGKIPSFFSETYKELAKDYIDYVMKNIPRTTMVTYETFVEPQYIGTQLLDYSDNAINSYRNYLSERWSLSYLNNLWNTNYSNYSQINLPTSYNDSNISGNVQLQWDWWNKYRSIVLTDFNNMMIRSIRNIAGDNALVAMDYLYVEDVLNRLGGDTQYIVENAEVNIWQNNWHWYPFSAIPYEEAYNQTAPIAKKKNQAISEHMTIAGGEWNATYCNSVLEHTFERGNKYGWEVVNAYANPGDIFCVFNSDWTSKAQVQPLESNLSYWKSRASQEINNGIILAKVILQSANSGYNLIQINGGDGTTVICTKAGIECRGTQPWNYYIYCDVADNIDTNSIEIEVQYFDEGTDKFSIQYNSKSNGDYKSTESVTKTGTNTWKTYKFIINDAEFRNAQNLGCDFRISDNGDGVEYIRSIVVR